MACAAVQGVRRKARQAVVRERKGPLVYLHLKQLRLRRSVYKGLGMSKADLADTLGLQELKAFEGY